MQNFSVPPQEMITKDSVTVYVNAIMYYKVFANVRTCLMFKVHEIRCKRVIIRAVGGVAHCCATFLLHLGREIFMIESK